MPLVNSSIFPFWSGFSCDCVLQVSKVCCNESGWLWMKEVFPFSLPTPILPPELNQPFSPCRRSLLLAPHIGFHCPENNSVISSHFSPYPSQVGHICSHSGLWHSQMNYSLIGVRTVAPDDVICSILARESWALIKMLMLWPYSRMQTYFYANAPIHLAFLIFAYSKSIRASVLAASCIIKTILGMYATNVHTSHSEAGVSSQALQINITWCVANEKTGNSFMKQTALWSSRENDVGYTPARESHPILHATMKRRAESTCRSVWPQLNAACCVWSPQNPAVGSFARPCHSGAELLHSGCLCLFV